MGQTKVKDQKEGITNRQNIILYVYMYILSLLINHMILCGSL